METSLKAYNDFLTANGSEFPVAAAMIKSAMDRIAENTGKLDKTAEFQKINTTDEDKIKNYLLEKMAGKPLRDQQIVLDGINARLEQLRQEGTPIVPDTIIKQIEDKTFL